MSYINESFKFATTSVTSYSFLLAPVAVGNQIIFAVEQSGGAGAPSTMHDNLSNTYTQISTQTGGGDNHEFTVYNCHVTHAGTPTVSTTFSGTRDILIEGLVLQNVGTIHLTSPVHNGGTSASWSSEPITISAQSILVAFDVAYDPPAAIADAFVSAQSGILVDTPNVQLDTAYQFSTPGTYTSSWTQASSAEWLTVIVSFSLIAETDFVEGYLLTSQVDAKSALQNLMAAFFLDVVESDFKLKFIPRGFNPPTLTIPEDDLGLEADKAKLIETHIMAQELPRFVDVIYVDPTIDWQQNKQHKARSSRVIKSKQALTMSLPMVLDADFARQIAEKALYLAWLERKPWTFNLFRSKYMVVDPADTIQFVYQGLTYTMRVVGNTIGVNYGMQIQGVSEDQNNYSSSVAGAGDPAISPTTPNPLFPTFLFLLDIPYLQDSDAVSDRSTTGYYMGMTATDSRWVGGVLYRSSDDVNFDSIDSSTDRMWFGQLNNTLGDPPILFTWDNVNTIDITMADSKNFTLAGVTDVDVLNGANVLIVGNEVIQYVNAVQTSPGRYTLSRLLRGRRNTEYAAYGHGSSERAFDPTTGLKHETTPLSLIDLLRHYRGVTVGADITTVADTNLTIVANDLKPASATSINGVRDISLNLTIGWTRRTRYAGDWLNNTGNVSLNEDSEAYSIDIYSAGFGSVLRTIAWTPGTYDGNGNPEAAYSAADQTTDFGSPQASIDIKVYQISAQVGRGQEGKAIV